METLATIANFIKSFPAFAWDLVKLGIGALFDVISLFLFLIFDGFCFVVTMFISALDLSALAFTSFAEWSNLPTQAIYLINQLSLPQCVSIILGAITIRMVLNLIPSVFTRL
jgi:hypothetical protein